jgi:hypothetical protein
MEALGRIVIINNQFNKRLKRGITQFVDFYGIFYGILHNDAEKHAITIIIF